MRFTSTLALLLLGTTLGHAACSGVPSPERVARAQIGEPPSRETAVALATAHLKATLPAIDPKTLVFEQLERGFYGLGAGSRNQRYAWQLSASPANAGRSSATEGTNYLFFFLGERLVAAAFPNSAWTGRGYRSSYEIQEFDGGGLTPEAAGLERRFVPRN